MKRIAVICICIAALFASAGCGGSTAPQTSITLKHSRGWYEQRIEKIDAGLARARVGLHHLKSLAGE